MAYETGCNMMCCGRWTRVHTLGEKGSQQCHRFKRSPDDQSPCCGGYHAGHVGVGMLAGSRVRPRGAWAGRPARYSRTGGGGAEHPAHRVVSRRGAAADRTRCRDKASGSRLPCALTHPAHAGHDGSARSVPNSCTGSRAECGPSIRRSRLVLATPAPSPLQARSNVGGPGLSVKHPSCPAGSHQSARGYTITAAC